MTDRQKRLLEPVAIVLAGINEDLKNKDDEEILELMQASCAVSQTNCWRWTYDAGRYLAEALREQIKERGLKDTVA